MPSEAFTTERDVVVVEFQGGCAEFDASVECDLKRGLRGGSARSRRWAPRQVVLENGDR
jgi:hypothetical protein